jgi:hypothetical protein
MQAVQNLDRKLREQIQKGTAGKVTNGTARRWDGLFLDSGM